MARCGKAFLRAGSGSWKVGGESLQKQRLMDLIDLPVWLSKADDNMQLDELFGAAKFRMRSANPLLQLKPD